MEEKDEIECVNSLTALKNIFYDIIKTPMGQKNDGELAATIQQDMRVAMTKTVQKDSNIIFLQHASIHIEKIVNSAVDGLRLIDGMAHAQLLQPPPIEIKALPAPEEEKDTDPIYAACSFFAARSLGLKEAQELIRQKYVEFIVQKHGTRKDAAEFLKIQRTYLSRLTNQMDVEED